MKYCGVKYVHFIYFQFVSVACFEYIMYVTLNLNLKVSLRAEITFK